MRFLLQCLSQPYLNLIGAALLTGFPDFHLSASLKIGDSGPYFETSFSAPLMGLELLFIIP